MPNPPTQVGRYQIVGSIGEGGMGTLYKALDPKLDRQIAIKLLRGNDDELRKRFAREGRSVARLRHPNIVTIFDVGEDNGQPYIAMEFIQGETLAQIIQRRTPVELARKLELIEALCDGLGYAHKAGVVHRDIKPANLMVDTDGALKILDFGIARVTNVTDGGSVTRAGMVLGTLNYMSPEQVSGQQVDARSDIFAVGLVLYEIIGGRQAFPGGLETGVLNRILSQPPPSLESASGITPDILHVVNQAVAKAPADRYQDLAAMRHDLQSVRAHLGNSGAAAVILDASTAAPSATTIILPASRSRTANRDQPAQPRARTSGRTAGIAVGAVALAGLAVGGYAIEHSKAAAPSTSPAATPPPSRSQAEPPAPASADPTGSAPPTTAPTRTAPPPAPAPVATQASSPVKPADDPAEARISALLDDARRRYGQDDRAAAMDDIRRSLQLHADDRATRDLVLVWLRAAVTDAHRAEAAANSVGSPATNSKNYQDGAAKESESMLRASDHPEQAVQLLWDATTLFSQAALDGRKANATAPVSAPPPSKPAAPEPPQALDEKGEVMKVLDAYSLAEGALDAAAVQRIYLKAPADLKEKFDRLKSQRFQLSNVDITINGAQATAHGVEKVSAVPRNGKEASTPAAKRTFTLMKMNGAWMIADIK